jgi:glycosyltransferase involved in cell wall biosynthesis
VRQPWNCRVLSGKSTMSEPGLNTAAPKYRFGFVLSTALGNLTRYQNFRKFAERDPQVDFVWAPVKHFIAPNETNPFRFLPGPLRRRAIVLHQSAAVLRQLGRFDAVMIHMYEVDILTALRQYFFKGPLRVISTDDAPVVDPLTYPMHPVDRKKPKWRRALRLRIDLWRARRADLLVPFSNWAGDIIVAGAGVPRERVLPIHVGLDLSLWRCEPKPVRAAAERVKLLFVGGEFVRKGGHHLLEAFGRYLSECTELHLVTKSAPKTLPPNVYVYDDLNANDERLARLYREADILVHPTTSDLSSWVVLEAMASGCATVATPVGGIRDFVEEGENGVFVAVGDVDGLAAAIKSLVVDPAKRHRMGMSGRRMVEERFDAAMNVPAILQTMKTAVDRRRNGQ